VLEVIPRLTRIGKKAAAHGIRMWPGNNIGYYGPFESILRGHINGQRRGSCGAGIKSLGIEANGAIKGCPSLPSSDYVGGNIRDAKLKDIWHRADALRFMRDHTTAKDLSGFCATCYYAEECKGGCQWTAHVLTGHRGNNPYCHHRALTLLERGVRERVELKAPAPGEPFDHATYVIVEEPWEDAARERMLALQSLDGLR
jgi:radical SAM protein with 4Fe4S-binding SPASM domain